ncbi:MAG: hypothetical protein NT027_02765 [Proteobacteria bacterium]|nr:hypothetical protein [Pseudomonadota bacterium]
MRTIKAAILVGYLLAGNAFAGVSSSGGAGVIVCGSKVRLLDLFEAESRGLQLEADLGSLRGNYLQFTSKILTVTGSSRAGDEAYISNYTDNLLKALFQDNFRFLAPGADLKSTNDFGELPTFPAGCSLQQLAVYNDQTQEILIDSDYWNDLSFQDQAAMIAHELLYREYRANGDTSSKSIRKLVGEYFSTKNLPSIFHGVPDSAISCSAIDFKTKPGSFQRGSLSGKLFLSGKSTNLQLAEFADQNLHEVLNLSFDVVIDINALQAVLRPDGHSAVMVNDPQANFEQVVSISSGIFQGQRVSLEYRYRQPLRLKLFGANGALKSTSTFITCN